MPPTNGWLFKHRHYGYLLVFLLLAYLPLSSFQFALKNDAYLYNFPNKFFFSDALHNGILPTWNPYLNFGFPLYADPGFAWWHPLTWIFGLLGYNAYTFTIEVLVYIFIAGCGMYRLCQTLHLHSRSAFLAGTMFMCCGFFIGNLQHINFLTCAAFLPWVVSGWIKLHNAPSVTRMFSAGSAIYLMVTGGHPAIPIGALYFLLFFAGMYWWLEKRSIDSKRFLLLNLGLVLCASVLLFLPLYSWLKLMPYYARSHEVDQALQTKLGFTTPCYLSFLNPLPTARNSTFFNTDVSMRNGYFSILGIAGVLIATFKSNKNNCTKLFLSAAIFGLVLSQGGSIKYHLFEGLPLLGFIRSNGEFRVFGLFSLIVASAITIDSLIHKELYTSNNYKKVLAGISLVSLTVLIFILVRYDVHAALSLPRTVSGLKQLLDSLTFLHFIFTGSVISFFTATTGFIILHFKKLGLFTPLLLADLFINTLLMLPITGVGKVSTLAMQRIFNRAPKGFQKLNLNQPNITISKDEKLLIGDWQWYNKNLLKDSLLDYPSTLKSSHKKLQGLKDAPLPRETFIKMKGRSSTLQINLLLPNCIVVQVYALHDDTLIINQNYYPGWRVKVNGINQPIHVTQSEQLKIPIKSGRAEVTVYFSVLNSLFAKNKHGSIHENVFPY